MEEKNISLIPPRSPLKSWRERGVMMMGYAPVFDEDEEYTTCCICPNCGEKSAFESKELDDNGIQPCPYCGTPILIKE